MDSTNSMNSLIEQWVADAIPNERLFRQTVHLVLLSISYCDELSNFLVIKGGMLMAIKYTNQRHTTDIDLSSLALISDISPDKVRGRLDVGFRRAASETLYGIECRVQSIKTQPKDFESASFPSLKVTVGYCSKSSVSGMRRLEDGFSPQTISIDISFNECVGEISDLDSTDEHKILCYSLESIISEKFRSLLQQVVRNRGRRQDVYDLNHLISKEAKNTPEEKTVVYQSLIRQSEGKNIEAYLNKYALDDPEIKSRAQENYHLLKIEVENNPLNFEEAYNFINSYFKSLPWEDKTVVR